MRGRKRLSCVLSPIGLIGVLGLFAFAAVAQAINLPVDGDYGASAGCALLAAHGMAAVIEAGGTETFPESGDDDIVLTPTRIAGPDWVCEPGTVDGEYAALLCVSMGATWVPMPVAHFDRSGEEIHFTMYDEEPVTLERCR